jgi:hypothetical protein
VNTRELRVPKRYNETVPSKLEESYIFTGVLLSKLISGQIGIENSI